MQTPWWPSPVFSFLKFHRSIWNLFRGILSTSPTQANPLFCIMLLKLLLSPAASRILFGDRACPRGIILLMYLFSKKSMIMSDCFIGQLWQPYRRTMRTHARYTFIFSCDGTNYWFQRFESILKLLAASAIRLSLAGDITIQLYIASDVGELLYCFFWFTSTLELNHAIVRAKFCIGDID